MSENAQIIFIDDDEDILNAIQVIFKSHGMNIVATTNPDEVFNLLRTKTVGVLVSDQRMPLMSGYDLLRRAYEISPDTTRLILTGETDLSVAVKSVNDGHVYRYLLKPWKTEELILSVKQAMEMFQLLYEKKSLLEIIKQQNQKLSDINHSLEVTVNERTSKIEELNKQLEHNFLESIKVMGSIYELSNAAASGHSSRVAKVAAAFAKTLPITPEDQFQIQVAGFLHDIGRIGLPQEKISMNVDVTDNHYSRGAEIVRRMPKLETAAKYVVHHHEKFDGSGVPTGLRAKNIPLGAQVISIADVYDELMFGSAGEVYTQEAALKKIKTMAGTYFDPELVANFENFLNATDQYKNKPAENEIEFYELKVGMVLARPICNKAGKEILPKDYKVSAVALELLWREREQNNLTGTVFIQHEA